MPLTISGPTGPNYDDNPPDWPALKAEVLSQLNVVEEYEKLGVKFPNKVRGGKDFCWVACHAYGREDNVASAAVHADLGIYVDKGGEQKAKDFFKFAAEVGPYGSWMAGFRHYADQVGVKIGPVRRYGGGKVLERIFEYRDAGGERRYACFRFILPNGSKKPSLARWEGGEWIRESGCMLGVDPLPYRLPDVLGTYSEQDYILWVEGEPDADAAYDAGFIATTSHMGSGSFSNTGAKFLHLLPAHDYVVIPDNDPEGRAYAVEVAAALKEHFGAEATVKVVALPGCPYKGSVSDWIGLHGTAAELRALIAAAPAWEPGASVEPPAPEGDELRKLDCSIGDLRRHVSDCPWVWTGWMPSAALTLLASEAGAGKTRLMMDLHRRAYHGLRWPDDVEMNLPPGGNVVWIVADNHHEQMALETTNFGLPDDAVWLNTKRDEPFAGTTLVTPEQLEDLEARIRRLSPYWVVIDTITNTGDFKTQDSVDAKKQYKPLQEIAQRTKTPIVCVTHTNAGGKVLGRRAGEKVRVVIMFSEPDREGQPDRRRLWVEKSFAQKPPARGVTVTPGAYEYDDDPPEESSGGDGGPARNAKFLACRKWFENALEAGASPVHELIDLCVAEGFSKTMLYNVKDACNNVEAYRQEGRQFWRLVYPRVVAGDAS